MSGRQLARKIAKPPAQKLRLVPPPKRKRKPKWRLGRSRRPKYGANPVLLRYENELILKALASYGGTASPRGMCEREPGRWHQAGLSRAMARMRREGLLTARTGWATRRPGTIYSIKPTPRGEN